MTQRKLEQAVRHLPNATRDRALALVSRLFNPFETWEWRAQRTNPVRGVERVGEEAKDRVLDSGEEAALSASLDRLERGTPRALPRPGWQR